MIVRPRRQCTPLGGAGERPFAPVECGRHAGWQTSREIPVQHLCLTCQARFGLYALIWLAASAFWRPTARAAEPLEKARQALGKREFAEAVRLASEAISEDAENPAAFLIRAAALEGARDFAAAAADFDQVLKLQGESAQLLRRRGAAWFRAGDVAAALADWDREIELKPAAMPDHWMRGIALYYVGRFAEGAEQFGAYQTVDGNDVENAVWHFLCRARDVGVDQARAGMLTIRNDGRVPMMQVYQLFRGVQSVDDVMQAAEADAPPEAKRQHLFFAHLYLGLFAEAQGDADGCLAHLRQATGSYAQPHYMGDVARVHLAQRASADSTTERSTTEKP